MATHNTDIAIVGGGIWGLSTAYHLARSGQKRVCVLERNPAVAQETTPRAAGLVGQIRSDIVMIRAIQYGLELLSGFNEQTGHDPGFRQTGSLMLALTADRLEDFEQQVQRAQEHGVDADFVGRAEMERLAPSIDVSRVLGGYFVTKDGYVDPLQCARAYGRAATDLGVSIVLGTRVTGLRVNRDRIMGVETAEGLVEAESVLISAGPWSAMLAAKAGFRPAVQPIRHQRVRTVPAKGIPVDHPVTRVPDLSCYLRPEKDGYLYGFFEPEAASIDLESLPDEFTTSDIEPPVDVMSEAQRRLAPIFPILEELEVAERSQGVTTFAPDGSYMVGPVPEVNGLFLATGCAALGIAGSPAIGLWLARWMLECDPGTDLGPFALDRFGERASDRSWVQRASEEFYGSYYSIRAS